MRRPAFIVLKLCLPILSAGSFFPYLQTIEPYYAAAILWLGIKAAQLYPDTIVHNSAAPSLRLFLLALDGAIVYHSIESLDLGSIVLCISHLATPFSLSTLFALTPPIKSASSPMSEKLALTLPKELPDRTQSQTQTQPLPIPQWDFLSISTNSIGNRFVFGLPGCGKGMVMANWLRAIKAQHDVQIVYIDPKADPKESGYFEGAVDYYHAGKISRMDSKEAIEFIKSGLREYDRLCDTSTHAYTLLVLDEGTAIGKLFSSERDNFLDRKLTEYVSCGDSGGSNVWFVSQSPFMDDLGLKSGAATQLLKLIIARDKDLESIRSWGNAVLMRGIDIDSAKSAIGKSPVRRAIYWGGEGAGWYPMPTLPNYSGFDRDTRTFDPRVSVTGDLSPSIPLNSHHVNASPRQRVTASSALGSESGFEDLGVVTSDASTRQVTPLESAILACLSASGEPRSLKQLKWSSGVRKFDPTDDELSSALDSLNRSETIYTPFGGHWQIAATIDRP